MQFARDGAVDVSGDGVGLCRYTLTVDDFVNGGEWRFRLADDGRIVWLAHRPDSLPDDTDAQLERLGSTPMRPNALALEQHEHDEEHD